MAISNFPPFQRNLSGFCGKQNIEIAAWLQNETCHLMVHRHAMVLLRLFKHVTHSFSNLFSAVSPTSGGASDQSWLAYAGDLVTEQGLFSFRLQQWRYVLTLSATSLDISRLPPEITLIKKHLTDANLAASLTVAWWQRDKPPKVPVTQEAESSRAKDACTLNYGMIEPLFRLTWQSLKLTSWGELPMRQIC